MRPRVAWPSARSAYVTPTSPFSPRSSMKRGLRGHAPHEKEGVEEQVEDKRVLVVVEQGQAGVEQGKEWAQNHSE